MLLLLTEVPVSVVDTPTKNTDMEVNKSWLSKRYDWKLPTEACNLYRLQTARFRGGRMGDLDTVGVSKNKQDVTVYSLLFPYIAPTNFQ